MPEYRRAYVPGGTFFFTLVTYNRQPIFSVPENISRLRIATATVRSEMPFKVTAAVVLPEHIHFLWTLPDGDTAYSKRLGRLKILFTQSLRGRGALPQNVSSSRQKHRESDVWHRRFWEHVICDEADFENHLNYIHYNPVKHGLVSCPHLWESSSFHGYVKQGVYMDNWACVCSGEEIQMHDFSAIGEKVGE
jgi:putative transposase